MSTRIASIIGSCALGAATAVWAAAPTPVAVWDGDFSAESLSKNGWTLNLMGNALSADNSTITIDRDNNGVRLDADTAVDGVTVVVRYSGLATGPSGRVLATSSVNKDYDRTGIRLTTGGALCGCANNSTDSGAMSNYGTIDGSAPSSGYMAFVYKGTSDDRGTFIYFKSAGGTYPAASSWGKYQLSYEADAGVSGVTLGGLRQAVSGWTAAKGMSITGVAVFEGRVPVDELEAYSFPAADYAVAADTTVSALNVALGDAREVALSVSPDVTITYDATFAASIVRMSSTGNIKFAAKAPPSAAELAKLDLSGVQGSVVRTWLNPGVVGYNFRNDSGGETDGQLATGGTWFISANSGNGTDTGLFADGLSKLSWSASGTWASGVGSSITTGYLDDNSSQSPVIMLSAVPYASYDVVIYCSTDSDNFKFSAKEVNGKLYTWNGSQTIETTDSNDAWGQSKSATIDEGTNALRVNGLSGSLTIKGGKYSNTTDLKCRGCIAAIQIMPSGVSSGKSEIVIDATEGWTTTDSDMLSGIRTSYRNVHVLGSGQNGATLNFGDLNAASMYISSHIVFYGGTHAVTIDGANNSTIGSNASEPILEVLDGTTLDFYQHDLSGWLGSAAAKVPSCNIQVDAGGQMNIRLDGAGTTYYQGRYTIYPGATVTSYVTTGNDAGSHLRFNGGAVEGSEQIYVPATTTSEPGVARFNGIEGNTGIFLASDETAGLGIFVGDNSTLEFDLDIAGVAAAPLAKWGEGRLNFNGGLSGYAGTLTVNEGTVQLGDTSVASLVNNATVEVVYGGENSEGQVVGTKITSYSGTGDIWVTLTQDLLDEIENNPSSDGYTLLPGVRIRADKVRVGNAPAGYSVHVSGNGMVLSNGTDGYPEWTGASNDWSSSQFDGRQFATENMDVFFSQGEQPETAVTVTANHAPTVNSITFIADDTAYTLSPHSGPNADKVTSTGTLSVSGLAPVRVETPLEVAGIALGEGSEFTFANTALTVPEGQLTGSGTLILDPGEGKEFTMSAANIGYTGEAVIASGTVKMGHHECFGQMNRAASVRVKGGATLDENLAECKSVYYAENGYANRVVLEDGATFTSSSDNFYQGSPDNKYAPVSSLTLEGDANAVADVADVAMSLAYNWDYTHINLGGYTLTKTGDHDFYVSAPSISGSGVLDVKAGGLVMSASYWGSRQGTFSDGTLKLAAGTVFKMTPYLDHAPTFTVKNLELNGSVHRDDEASTLTVTGYVTGNGTTPMLTLAEGAVFKPTGTGYLTVSESLSGTMTIDLSGIDMAHVMAVPLFKVGSAENLPASSDLVFSESLPRGWKLAVTRDGCGYKLAKQAFDIRLR